MGVNDKNKRGVLTAVTSLAAAAVAAPAANAAIRPKASGETKVVAVFGTTGWNNGIGHELQVRRIFDSKRNWRLVAVRANRFFTPELIADADLLILNRDGEPDPIDLFVDDAGRGDSVKPGSPLWTSRNVDAVIDNVERRGMGLIALHNTIMAGDRRLLDFLDVKELEKHEFEPLWFRYVNKEHPVTNGVGKFMIDLDEQYGVMIKSPETATLLETTAIHEKRQVVSGWALERGRGRIVGLLPGSTVHAYNAPEYRNIVWRAAHWAMKRDIEPYPEAENRYYG